MEESKEFNKMFNIKSDKERVEQQELLQGLIKPNKMDSIEESKTSFGVIWASLTFDQRYYLGGYIDKKIKEAHNNQQSKIQALEKEVERIDNGIVVKELTEENTKLKERVKELEEVLTDENIEEMLPFKPTNGSEANTLFNVATMQARGGAKMLRDKLLTKQ